jgi:hypothetical protein
MMLKMLDIQRFNDLFPQMVIKEINMKIIVVNPDLNTVVQWIK